MSITRFQSVSISGYIPHFVSHYCNSIAERKIPNQFLIQTGLLFIDVCDYTAITEKVTQTGHYGIETITSILNSYYEAMNQAINTYGGEIIKYAGDAALAVFIGDKDHCLNAISDAVGALQESLVTLNKQYQKQYGIQVLFHGSAAWGDCSLMVFGDEDQDLNFILHGELLQKLYEGSIKSSKNEVYFIDQFERQSLDRNAIQEIHTEGKLYTEQDFIPEALVQNVDFSHFSGELRTTAILFIAVEYGDLSEADFLIELDSVYKYIQHSIYKFEGLINKIDYTDKGLVILCSFGIPNTHLDDIERAVICARRLIRYKGKSGFRIGITYSNIYAGFLGSKNRFEYGIIGNGVNIAARLMSEAKVNQILLTEEILSHIEVRFKTEYLMQAKVKGIKDPVSIYRIEDEIPVNQHSLYKLYQGQTLIAWHEEYDEVSKAIAELRGSFVYVNGDPGVGKTFFAWQVLQSIVQKDSNILIIALEEYNQPSLYFIIINILQKIWNVHNPIMEFERLYDTVDVVQYDLDVELLRNHLSGVQPQYLTDADRKYYSDMVSNQLLNLLTALLTSYKFVFIDNIQWLDQSSLKLFLSFIQLPVSEDVHILVTARFGIHRDFFAERTTCAVDLKNLSSAETAKLVNGNLESIADDAVAYLYQITGGNPLFIVEICRLVKQKLAIQNNLITQANIAQLEHDGLLPHSIENLFITRFSTLGKESQYILKIASIVGKAFTLNEIAMIDRSYVKDQIIGFLANLDSANAITKTSISPDIEYIFTHSLMRDAIYNTILLSEKKGLHNLIASYYEKKSAGDVDPELDIIANHYILAENTKKALYFCKKAGEKHYKLSNYEESNFYFENSLVFCKDDQEAFAIKLNLVDNLFLLGNTLKASRLLGELILLPVKEQIHKDKLIWLMAKKFFLNSKYMEMVEYCEANITDVQDRHFKFMLQIYYAESLRMLSMHDKLELVIQNLLCDVLEIVNKAMGKAYVYQTDLAGLVEELKSRVDNADIRQSMYYMDKIEALAGYADMDRSRYQTAMQHFENKLILALAIEDNLSQRIAYHSLGLVNSRLGKKDEAMKLLEKALHIAGSMGDRFGYGKVLADIGTIQRAATDFEAAFETYDKSLKMAISMGNKLQQETIVYNIGEMHYQLQDYEKAESCFTQAKAIAEAISDQVGLGYAIDALGDLYFTQGDLDKAESYYLANLERQEKIDDAEGLGHTYGNLANVAKRRGQYDLAAEYYIKNTELCQRVGDIDGEGRSWFNRAMWDVDQKDYKSAMANLRKAEACFVEAKSMVYMDILHEQIKLCGERLAEQEHP